MFMGDRGNRVRRGRRRTLAPWTRGGDAPDALGSAAACDDGAMSAAVQDTHREAVVLTWCIGALSLSYGLLSGHRWDYLAHFVLGAGLALLAVLVAWEVGVHHDVAGVSALVLVLAASIAGEFWFFSALLVDWADVGSGVLGAGVVAAVAVRARPATLGVRTAGPLTLFLLLAGVVLRYGFDEGVGL